MAVLGVVPNGNGTVSAWAEGTGSAVKDFLRKNPKMERVKAARDAKGGIFKVIDILLFAFLLFSPVLGLMPQMEEPAIVLILWVLIILIMWCKIEWNNRGEVWYICLYRGIILDFPKTHTAKGWLLEIPTLLAVLYLLVFGIVCYIGLDPKFTFKNTSYIVSAIFAILGILFVFTMTKAYVCVEAAPHLLTLNLLVFLFKDPEMLKAKGFKVVHFARLQAFVNERKKNGDKSFSWNEVYDLSNEPDNSKISPIGGTKMWMYLRPFRDLDQ